MRDSGPGISVGCRITCCKLWSVLSQSMLLDSMLVKSGVSDAKLPPTWNFPLPEIIKLLYPNFFEKKIKEN